QSPRLPPDGRRKIQVAGDMVRRERHGLQSDAGRTPGDRGGCAQGRRRQSHWRGGSHRAADDTDFGRSDFQHSAKPDLYE
ncbi:hypothetical protein ABTI23_20060, partial [Acinetobacter baumannii]